MNTKKQASENAISYDTPHVGHARHPLYGPPLYGIVGLGRVGRAFATHFHRLQISFVIFQRQSPDETIDMFVSKILSSWVRDPAPSKLLLTLSDPALKPFVEELQRQCRLKRISCPRLLHFSGSVQIEGTYGFHPLYSFTHRDLSQSEFESIPFNVDPLQGKAFRELLPELKNPVFEMSQSKNALYHALCVSLGNLPQYIQNTSLQFIKKDFGLPTEALLPFLKSLLRNLEENSSELVSGPIARKDQFTIDKHLSALSEKSPLLYEVYQALARRLL